MTAATITSPITSRPQGLAVTSRFSVRPGRGSDCDFVIRTWLEDYRSYSTWARHLSKSLYFSRHHPIVERLVGSCELRVACAPEHEDTILGFAVLAPGVLHYCYVRSPFWRAGVATALCEPLGAQWVVTHRTRMADEILSAWDLENALVEGRCPRCHRALVTVAVRTHCLGRACAWQRVRQAGEKPVRARPRVIYDPYLALLGP